jgi:hypothetical protein
MVDALAVAFIVDHLALVLAAVHVVLDPNTLTVPALLIEDPLHLETVHDIILLLQHPSSFLLEIDGLLFLTDLILHNR